MFLLWYVATNLSSLRFSLLLLLDSNALLWRPIQGAKQSHKEMAHKGIFQGSWIVEQTGQHPSETSRGRWRCGPGPPAKRQTPFPEHIPLYLCVFMGPVKGKTYLSPFGQV